MFNAINLKILFNIFLIILLIPLALTGAQADDKGEGFPNKDISGFVIDIKGIPLADANITIPALDRVVPTDSEGRFVLRHLPTGPILIEISHVGYRSLILQVDVTSKPKDNLKIILKERTLKGGDIVVTGSPSAVDPSLTPQDIQVIGSQKLFVGETSALGKVLEKLPGISSIGTGPEAGKPVIRGLSGNRIRVMKDGVPMEHYQFSFRHQPVLNLAQADRVEVVEGGAGILYGSDALGGAANVITKPLPAGITGRSYLNGTLKSQYFSNNRERSGGVDLEGASGVVGYRFGFTARHADNFRTPDEATYSETNNMGDPKFTGELPYTNFNQYSGFALVGVSGSFGNLMTIYDHYDSEQNYLLGDGNPIGQNLKNDNIKIKGNFFVSSKVTLKPTLSLQRNTRQATEGVDFESNPDWKVDLVRSVYVARLDLNHTDLYGLSGTVGIDLNVQNQETRASGLLPNADVFDVGLYVFEEYSYNDLILNAGLRYDYREHEAEANAAMSLPDTVAGETDDVLTQAYSVFSGSAGAGYRLTEYLTLASNFSLGFRAPDLFELHACGIHGGVQAFQIGNPYLEPERSYSIDASLRLNMDRAAAKATIYYNRIDNYIFLRNRGSDTTIGTTTLPILVADQTNGIINGIELSGEVDVLSWLRINAAYSAINSENRATDEELPLMPADKITVGLRISAPDTDLFRNSFAEFGLKYAMSKNSAGTYEPFSQFDVIPFGTASTDAYTIFDVGIGTTLNFEGVPISIYLEAENIFDKAYVDFLDTYKGYALSMGRNISLRIQAPLHIL